MKLTQALISAVQLRKDAPGTIHAGRSRSWKEIGRRVACAAGGLRRLGIEPGDRVAILAHNSDLYIEALYAIAWAGAVAVPLNTRWAAAENAYAIDDSTPKLLLVDKAFAEIGSALRGAKSLTAMVYLDEGQVPDGMQGYDELVAHAPIEDASGAYNDLAGIFYTGGTTGFPKGVMLSHANIIYESLVWIYALRFREDTRYLHSAGMFHLAGTSPMIALTLVGGTHVTIPKFEPELAMKTIAEHKVDYCLFVPTMLNMMLNHPSFGTYDLSSVRDCEYGASPMPDALLVKLMRVLPSWRFHQGYGMTESAALATILPWEYHALEGPLAGKRKSAGRAAPGVEIRIVDPAGNEVPRGTVGEIAIRGAGVMLGYWRKPEESARVLRNGWLHTGDGAWMDEDGFVYIVDRLKDMIVSGGENVYSGEVENAIFQHDQVKECAVIAVPDPQWGEAVHAIVVPKDGARLDSETVIAHCRTLIAGYKCPRSVDIRLEPLPLTGSGKIMKSALREEKWQGYTRSVN
ncbi:acyl-CoA synthetase [Bradyrhizobium tropiciagri]|uniref:acyl-CoA synthetase n=1 Tax=Bradyrhizobium tropiciagri TaxID=312253 RepID=UPI00067DE9A7|nr:long-chain fatty acid--CoA ligase [Bradyrhizobium tropiciagri]